MSEEEFFDLEKFVFLSSIVGSCSFPENDQCVVKDRNNALVALQQLGFKIFSAKDVPESVVGVYKSFLPNVSVAPYILRKVKETGEEVSSIMSLFEPNWDLLGAALDSIRNVLRSLISEWRQSQSPNRNRVEATSSISLPFVALVFAAQSAYSYRNVSIRGLSAILATFRSSNPVRDCLQPYFPTLFQRLPTDSVYLSFDEMWDNAKIVGTSGSKEAVTSLHRSHTNLQLTGASGNGSPRRSALASSELSRDDGVHNTDEYPARSLAKVSLVDVTANQAKNTTQFSDSTPGSQIDAVEDSAESKFESRNCQGNTVHSSFGEMTSLNGTIANTPTPIVDNWHLCLDELSDVHLANVVYSTLADEFMKSGAKDWNEIQNSLDADTIVGQRIDNNDEKRKFRVFRTIFLPSPSPHQILVSLFLLSQTEPWKSPEYAFKRLLSIERDRLATEPNTANIGDDVQLAPIEFQTAVSKLVQLESGVNPRTLGPNIDLESYSDITTLASLLHPMKPTRSISSIAHRGFTLFGEHAHAFLSSLRRATQRSLVSHLYFPTGQNAQEIDTPVQTLRSDLDLFLQEFTSNMNRAFSRTAGFDQNLQSISLSLTFVAGDFTSPNGNVESKNTSIIGPQSHLLNKLMNSSNISLVQLLLTEQFLFPTYVPQSSVPFHSVAILHPVLKPTFLSLAAAADHSRITSWLAAHTNATRNTLFRALEELPSHSPAVSQIATWRKRLLSEGQLALNENESIPMVNLEVKMRYPFTLTSDEAMLFLDTVFHSLGSTRDLVEHLVEWVAEVLAVSSDQKNDDFKKHYQFIKRFHDQLRYFANPINMSEEGLGRFLDEIQQYSKLTTKYLHIALASQILAPTDKQKILQTLYQDTMVSTMLSALYLSQLFGPNRDESLRMALQTLQDSYVQMESLWKGKSMFDGSPCRKVASSATHEGSQEPKTLPIPRPPAPRRRTMTSDNLQGPSEVAAVEVTTASQLLDGPTLSDVCHTSPLIIPSFALSSLLEQEDNQVLGSIFSLGRHYVEAYTLAYDYPSIPASLNNSLDDLSDSDASSLKAALEMLRDSMMERFSACKHPTSDWAGCLNSLFGIREATLPIWYTSLYIQHRKNALKQIQQPISLIQHSEQINGGEGIGHELDMKERVESAVQVVEKICEPLQAIAPYIAEQLPPHPTPQECKEWIFQQHAAEQRLGFLTVIGTDVYSPAYASFYSLLSLFFSDTLAVAQSFATSTNWLEQKLHSNETASSGETALLVLKCKKRVVSLMETFSKLLDNPHFSRVLQFGNLFEDAAHTSSYPYLTPSVLRSVRTSCHFLTHILPPWYNQISLFALCITLNAILTTITMSQLSPLTSIPTSPILQQLTGILTSVQEFTNRFTPLFDDPQLLQRIERFKNAVNTASQDSKWLATQSSVYQKWSQTSNGKEYIVFSGQIGNQLPNEKRLIDSTRKLEKILQVFILLCSPSSDTCKKLHELRDLLSADSLEQLIRTYEDGENHMIDTLSSISIQLMDLIGGSNFLLDLKLILGTLHSPDAGNASMATIASALEFPTQVVDCMQWVDDVVSLAWYPNWMTTKGIPTRANAAAYVMELHAQNDIQLSCIYESIIGCFLSQLLALVVADVQPVQSFERETGHHVALSKSLSVFTIALLLADAPFLTFFTEKGKTGDVLLFRDRKDARFIRFTRLLQGLLDYLEMVNPNGKSTKSDGKPIPSDTGQLTVDLTSVCVQMLRVLIDLRMVSETSGIVSSMWLVRQAESILDSAHWFSLPRPYQSVKSKLERIQLTASRQVSLEAPGSLEPYEAIFTGQSKVIEMSLLQDHQKLKSMFQSDGTVHDAKLVDTFSCGILFNPTAYQSIQGPVKRILRLLQWNSPVVEIPLCISQSLWISPVNPAVLLAPLLRAEIDWVLVMHSEQTLFQRVKAMLRCLDLDIRVSVETAFEVSWPEQNTDTSSLNSADSSREFESLSSDISDFLSINPLVLTTTTPYFGCSLLNKARITNSSTIDAFQLALNWHSYLPREMLHLFSRCQPFLVPFRQFTLILNKGDTTLEMVDGTLLPLFRAMLVAFCSILPESNKIAAFFQKSLPLKASNSHNVNDVTAPTIGDCPYAYLPLFALVLSSQFRILNILADSGKGGLDLLMKPDNEYFNATVELVVKIFSEEGPQPFQLHTSVEKLLFESARRFQEHKIIYEIQDSWRRAHPTLSQFLELYSCVRESELSTKGIFIPENGVEMEAQYQAKLHNLQQAVLQLSLVVAEQRNAVLNYTSSSLYSKRVTDLKVTDDSIESQFSHFLYLLCPIVLLLGYLLPLSPESSTTELDIDTSAALLSIGEDNDAISAQALFSVAKGIWTSIHHVFLPATSHQSDAQSSRCGTRLCLESLQYAFGTNCQTLRSFLALLLRFLIISYTTYLVNGYQDHYLAALLPSASPTPLNSSIFEAQTGIQKAFVAISGFIFAGDVNLGQLASLYSSITTKEPLSMQELQKLPIYLPMLYEEILRLQRSPSFAASEQILTLLLTRSNAGTDYKQQASKYGTMESILTTCSLYSAPRMYFQTKSMGLESNVMQMLSELVSENTKVNSSLWHQDPMSPASLSLLLHLLSTGRILPLLVEALNKNEIAFKNVSMQFAVLPTFPIARHLVAVYFARYVDSVIMSRVHQSLVHIALTNEQTFPSQPPVFDSLPLPSHIFSPSRGGMPRKVMDKQDASVLPKHLTSKTLRELYGFLHIFRESFSPKLQNSGIISFLTNYLNIMMDKPLFELWISATTLITGEHGVDESNKPTEGQANNPMRKLMHLHTIMTKSYELFQSNSFRPMLRSRLLESLLQYVPRTLSEGEVSPQLKGFGEVLLPPLRDLHPHETTSANSDILCDFVCGVYNQWLYKLWGQANSEFLRFSWICIVLVIVRGANQSEMRKELSHPEWKQVDLELGGELLWMDEQLLNIPSINVLLFLLEMCTIYRSASFVGSEMGIASCSLCCSTLSSTHPQNITNLMKSDASSGGSRTAIPCPLSELGFALPLYTHLFAFMSEVLQRLLCNEESKVLERIYSLSLHHWPEYFTELVEKVLPVHLKAIATNGPCIELEKLSNEPWIQVTLPPLLRILLLNAMQSRQEQHLRALCRALRRPIVGANIQEFLHNLWSGFDDSLELQSHVLVEYAKQYPLPNSKTILLHNDHQAGSRMVQLFRQTCNRLASLYALSSPSVTEESDEKLRMISVADILRPEFLSHVHYLQSTSSSYSTFFPHVRATLEMSYTSSTQTDSSYPVEFIGAVRSILEQIQYLHVNRQSLESIVRSSDSFCPNMLLLQSPTVEEGPRSILPHLATHLSESDEQRTLVLDSIPKSAFPLWQLRSPTSSASTAGDKEYEILRPASESTTIDAFAKGWSSPVSGCSAPIDKASEVTDGDSHSVEDFNGVPGEHSLLRDSAPTSPSTPDFGHSKSIDDADHLLSRSTTVLQSPQTPSRDNTHVKIRDDSLRAQFVAKETPPPALFHTKTFEKVYGDAEEDGASISDTASCSTTSPGSSTSTLPLTFGDLFDIGNQSFQTLTNLDASLETPKQRNSAASFNPFDTPPDIPPNF